MPLYRRLVQGEPLQSLASPPRARAVAIFLAVALASAVCSCADDGGATVPAADAEGSQLTDAATDTHTLVAADTDESTVDDIALAPDVRTRERDSLGPGGAGFDAGASDTEIQDDTGGDQCPVPAPLPPESIVVAQGALLGTIDDGVQGWFGVPFAAPPLGVRRFAPPEAPACYDGLRIADTLPPRCPQRLEGEVVGSEDCLYLNVWARTTGTGPRPVMVFIHGGAFIQGSSVQQVPGGDLIYDGERLSRATGHVVVTLNYRLGALGYLAISDMLDEPHGQAGNFGPLDQIAALEWIQTNISAFGGDPDRVMIFGESAGASSVCALVASPLAAGLFHRAIMQSGGCGQRDQAAVIAAFDARMENTSCADSTDRLACLRALSVDALDSELPGSAGLGTAELQTDAANYGPIVDGHFLATSALNAFLAGTQNPVPLIMGSNAEEEANTSVEVSTRDELEAVVAAMLAVFGPTAASTVLAAYPASDYPSAQATLVAILTDMRFTCPTQWALESAAAGGAAPLYRYWFSKRPVTPQGSSTANHGIELLYVFNSMNNLVFTTQSGVEFPFPVHSSDEALSQTMMQAWGHFAATGTPNGDDTPIWPEWTPSTDDHLVFDAPVVTDQGIRTAQCAAWSAAAGQ